MENQPPPLISKFTSTVLRNSSWGIATQFLIRILSFIFSIFIVRRLGAEIYGQYTAVIAFIGIFAIFSDMGLSPFLVRQVARLREKSDTLNEISELYGSITSLRLILSLGTIILIVFFAWVTGRPAVMIGGIAYYSVSLILYAIQGTSESILAGCERLDLTAGVKVLNQALFVLIGAAVLFAGWGYYGLITANLLGIVLMAVMCWLYVKTLDVSFRIRLRQNWSVLIKAAVPFGLIGFALGLSYKFDSVLLNIFRGDVETGYYNAAYNLVFSAVVLSNVVNTALYPSLTRQAARENQKLPQVYGQALRYLLLLSLPVAAGVSLLADQIVPFLYKNGYQPAIPALKIIIWVLPFMYASEFLGYVVVIRNQERRVARAVLVSTGFNIGLNLILVPLFGYIAASVMTVLTEIVLVGQHIWTLRDLRAQFDWKRNLIQPVLAMAMMFIVVLVIHSKATLVINIVAGMVTYIVSLLAIGAVGKEEIALVRSVFATLTAPKRESNPLP